MSSQPRSHDGENLEESAEEEELLKLEEEVQEMAQKILDYQTTLPVQLSSTISSLFESQRPVYLLDEAEPQSRTLSEPDTDAGISQGLMREVTCLLQSTEDSDEAEKIQFLKKKIMSNATAIPLVLNRTKGYMVRMDTLDSSNVIINPAFKRKRTNLLL